MIKVGDTAPDFFLSDAQGRKHKLSDYRGHKIALYFYPKDDTPGCTKEACSFRDYHGDFLHNNITVIGISADSEESHKKFSSKYNLPFLILCDPDHSVIKKYGAFGEKTFMGKITASTLRKTFLIDEKGKLVKIFERVNPDEHAGEVLTAFDEMRE